MFVEQWLQMFLLWSRDAGVLQTKLSLQLHGETSTITQVFFGVSLHLELISLSKRTSILAGLEQEVGFAVDSSPARRLDITCTCSAYLKSPVSVGSSRAHANPCKLRENMQTSQRAALCY